MLLNSFCIKLFLSPLQLNDRFDVYMSTSLVIENMYKNTFRVL